MPGTLPSASPLPSQRPQAHFTAGETEALELAPWSTVRKWPSPRTKRECLMSSFQRAEDNTDLHAPLPAYSIPSSSSHPLRPPPAPKVTPLSHARCARQREKHLLVTKGAGVSSLPLCTAPSLSRLAPLGETGGRAGSSHPEPGAECVCLNSPLCLISPRVCEQQQQ